MLTLISPAKSLDYERHFDVENFSTPHFEKEIQQLIKKLKNLKSKDLEKLMKISTKLADLNFARFQNFSNKFDLKNSKQSLLVFDGDVYGSIDKDNYKKPDFDFAQNHLRILSGLYGILKPLDLMQPYRLEMGTDFKKAKLEEVLGVKNLYQFWGEKISNYLNEEEKDYIINLASGEYFEAVNPKIISAKIINIVFKEKKGDLYKIIGIHAKKARGAMADFIIKNKIQDPEKLKKFNLGNYKFHKELSDENNFVFVR